MQKQKRTAKLGAAQFLIYKFCFNPKLFDSNKFRAFGKFGKEFGNKNKQTEKKRK